MVAVYDGIRRAPGPAIRYFLFDHELDNFTYDIANRAELAAFIAQALNVDPALCQTFVNELANDRELERWLSVRLAPRPDRNAVMPFGRRLGWYCVARCLKPDLIVETGIHDGLGSVALLRALERNEHDGAPGHLLSFDIEQSAGWLIPDELRSRHTVVIGDSLTELPVAVEGRGVGLFIHDSDHRYEHEAAEFKVVAPYLLPRAAVISDNAHSTTALADFAAVEGFEFGFWKETPVRHFYPGAGIGLALKRPGGAASE